MGLSAPGVDSRGPLTKPNSNLKQDPASVISSKSRKKVHTNAGGGVVRSVFVTACGNFGLAGSSNGRIVMWNMQSGIRRRTFDVGRLDSVTSGDLSSRAKGKGKSTDRPVTGIAVDPLNRILVAATLDGTINVSVHLLFRVTWGSIFGPKFFNFHTTKLESVLRLPSSAVSLQLQPDSGLLAVICDDMTVRLVDLETRRLVREYTGFKGRILDIVSFLIA